MEKDKNIFDAARKKLAKKSNVPEVKRGKYRIKKRKLLVPPPPRELPRIVDQEIEEMRDKLRQMRNDIVEKLEIINKHSGVNAEQIRNYLSDQKNFTSTQWDELQSYRKILGERIFNAIGRDVNISTSSEQKNTPEPPKIKETTDTSRRGKTLGARKKWIPMR